MDLTASIKRIFGKKGILQREQLERLSRLPKDQARKELGTVLYEHCVNRAAEFVNGELRRGDSPYRGLSATVFYHEVLAVTFWLADREIAGGKKVLIDPLHDCYFRSPGSRQGSREEQQNALMKKYRQYEDTWNEITGHLDEFGLAVVRNLFGTGESLQTRERTFWIIQYADETAKAFSALRKTWKELRLAPADKPT